MTRLVISSPDAKRLAATFNDLISKKGLEAIERRTVNKIGSDLRKKTRAVGPAIFGTSAAALMVQGRAARPGADDPEYALRLARTIPVARLKASSRKATRQGGRLQLQLDTPAIDAIVFRSAKREGRGFSLVAAGPLPARGVGGIPTRAGTAFADEAAGGQPELSALRKRAARDLPDEMAKQINLVLRRRK